MKMLCTHYSALTLLGMFLGLCFITTTTIAQTICPPALQGDVNNDGRLTPNDAQQVLQHFLGIPPSLEPCAQELANVFEPESSGITPADVVCIFLTFLGEPSCLNDGRRLFFAREIVAADEILQRTLELDPTNQVAQLFRVSTRLMRIAEETRRGPDPNVFTDSFQEMAEQFGVIFEARSIFDFVARLPEDTQGNVDFPSEAPTTNDVKTFIETVLLPEITGAIDENFVHIDPTFSLTITQAEMEAIGIREKTGPVEIDYGDVKIFEAVLRATRSVLLSLVFVYDVDVDLAELDLGFSVAAPNLDAIHLQQDILDAHPAFLTPTADSTDLLPQAEASLRSAIEAYFTASHFIRTLDDTDQSDDAITIKPEDLADEEELRRLVGEILCSLDGVAFDALTDIGARCATAGPPRVDNEQVDLSRFFVAPFDIRAALPAFAFDAACGGNFIDTTSPTATSPFPDATFAGIWPARNQEELLDFLELIPRAETFISGGFDENTFFASPGTTEQGNLFVRYSSTKLDRLAPPLEIHNVAFIDGSVFHLDPPLSDTDFPQLLCKEGDGRFFGIAFSPPTSGNFMDTLLVQSNDAGEPLRQLPLNGCSGSFDACFPSLAFE